MLKNTRGFSFVELLLDFGIFAVIVIAFLGWVNFFHKAVDNLKKNDQVDNTMIKIVASFGTEDKYCEFHLKGKVFDPATGLQLQSLDFHNDTGQDIGNIVTVGQKIEPNSLIDTSKITLKTVGSTSAQNIITDLELTFNKVENGKVSDVVLRRLPILVTVDASNVITTCSTAGQSIVVMKGRLCEVKSDGFEHYEVIGDECFLNNNVKWFSSGNPLDATCPSGWTPAVSSLNQNPAYIACRALGADVAMPPRTYTSGTVASDVVTFYGATMDVSRTHCQFSYPADKPISAYTAQIKCVQGSP
jgi:hypothetical protein